ncbi:MAG: hypothetical protein LBI13_08880 [Streptococcaceae bacterium]|jgi:hypothetical protein|nr:hypothetical protein [Streptococcaceae bacterium]
MIAYMIFDIIVISALVWQKLDANGKRRFANPSNLPKLWGNGISCSKKWKNQ